jgi:hypothetical protein
MTLFVDRTQSYAAESAFYTRSSLFSDNIGFMQRLVRFGKIELSHSVILAVNTQPNQHLRQ